MLQSNKLIFNIYHQLWFHVLKCYSDVPNGIKRLLFLPEASFGLRVLSFPATVRVCICMCGNHLFVRAITCHPFKLESPNLDQKSKTLWLRSLLFWGVFDIELQDQIQLKGKTITIFWACPCHHSPSIQDKIFKFGPKMHLSTVKIPVNFGLDWHCPSISFLISKPTL